MKVSIRKMCFVAATAGAVVMAVLVALHSATAALAVIVVVLGVIVSAVRPGLLAPFLLTAAALFARPNLFGADYAPLSFVLVAAASLVAVASDAFKRGNHARTYSWTVPTLVAISYAAVAFAAALHGGDGATTNIANGAILTVGTLLGCTVILADPARRVLVAKLFIALVAAFCVSFLISVAGWITVGLPGTQIGTFDTGAVRDAQPFYLPFTPTVGAMALPGGITLPRLTGLGREPGWMAAYAAFAFFLAPRIGWSSWWLRGLLLLGMIGTFSTAGFGVFAVVLAYDLFLRRRPELSSASTFLLRTAGLAAMAVSFWAALNAPVFGLSAKVQNDRYSYGQRLDATLAGLRAAADDPFSGGNAAEVVGGVNLIASIALYGILFVIAVCLAIWVPMRNHPHRHIVAAPIAVIFLTLLTAQPPADSTWIYVCVMIAYAATLNSCADAVAPVRTVGCDEVAQR